MLESSKFKAEGAAEIEAQGRDRDLIAATRTWMDQAAAYKYSYHFEWMGRPIIQYPQDMMAVQEIIWSVKPDVIVETGIAHGGSIILSASILALIDMCEAIETGSTYNPAQSKRKVIGIDIDIRPHNRAAIESHPMASRIEMIEGSAIDPRIVAQVKDSVRYFDRVLVFLDSMHSHSHVLAELEAYAPLVSVGSYCVVFDTVIEDMPVGSFLDRPWDKGDNPKTAVRAFLKNNSEFQIDNAISDKLLISVAPDGYLKRIGLQKSI